MSLNRYVISKSEQNSIKKILNFDELFNLNFVLSDMEQNILLSNIDPKYPDILRDSKKYIECAKNIYSAMCKQNLNFKKFDEVEKIYIPMSEKEYEIYKNSNRCNAYLLGTTQKFIAEAKPFPEIQDLVILEAKLKNMPIYFTEEESGDISSVIIGGSFKILELSRKMTEDITFADEKIEKRKVIKVVLEYVQNKNGDSKKQDIDDIYSKSAEVSNDLKRYLKLVEENKFLSNKNNCNLNILHENGYLLNINEEDLENEIILDKDTNDENILNTLHNKYFSEKENMEDSKQDINNLEGKSVKEKIEYFQNQNQNIQKELKENSLTNEIKKIEKELEAKVKEVRGNIDHLLNKDELISVNKNNRNNNKNKYSKLINLEHLIKETIFKNEDEIEEIVKKAIEWKEKLLKNLRYDYQLTINKIENERLSYIKKANLTEKEREIYLKVEKTLKTNIENIEKLIANTEKLIKKQQKFARISANIGTNYAAISDGFKIREIAFKLDEILKNIYKNFEIKYTNRLHTDKEAENVENIEKLCVASEQIEVFFNYLNNSKSAKVGTNIDRFDELILLEENELKRKIFEYAKKIIANGNIKILNDEISIINEKTGFEKILDFITGKRKNTEYLKLKLLETISIINEQENTKLPIDKNYRIYDIVAEMMIFKNENLDDELVKIEIEKLTKLEEEINKSFSINTDKILKVIDEKQNNNLPLKEHLTKKEEIDIEINEFRKKYDYETVQKSDVEYEDTMANEIKQILDYTKIAF